MLWVHCGYDMYMIGQDLSSMYFSLAGIHYGFDMDAVKSWYESCIGLYKQ